MWQKHAPRIDRWKEQLRTKQDMSGYLTCSEGRHTKASIVRQSLVEYKSAQPAANYVL